MISGFVMRCAGIVLGKDNLTQVQIQVKGGSAAEETLRASVS